MPSKAGAAAVAPAAAAPASTAATPAPPPDFEPLTDEEVTFCWRSLVVQGELKPTRLQEFMHEVCGEKISLIQARDLIKYMDIKGDGHVGQEDFKHFLSVGCLEATNPKDFMWNQKPKRHAPEDKPAAEIAKPGRNSGDVVIASLAVPGDGGAGSEEHGGGGGADGSLGSRPCSAASAMASGTPRAGFDLAALHEVTTPGGASRPTLHGNHHGPRPCPEPKPPPGKRRGPPPRGTRIGATAAAAAAAATATSTSAETEADAGGHEPSPEKPKVKPIMVDDKTRAMIKTSLEKYERESWQHLLKYEEACRERGFKQFAVDPAKGMTVQEFHKMLQRWQSLARWNTPSDLRPADTMATLQYVLERDEHLSQANSAAAGDDAAGGLRGVPFSSEAAIAHDARLTYRLWLDLLKGRHRPDEHSRPAAAPSG